MMATEVRRIPMRKISLVVLFAATILGSGCYTKAYVQQLKAQQALQSSNTNQGVTQAHR
jgi:uncharacterized lipoprotein YajG